MTLMPTPAVTQAICRVIATLIALVIPTALPSSCFGWPQVFDADSPKPVAHLGPTAFRLPTGATNVVAFSSDGKAVGARGGGGRGIWVWTFPEGKQVADFPSGSAIHALAHRPELAILDRGDLVLVNAASGRVTRFSNDRFEPADAPRESSGVREVRSLSPDLLLVRNYLGLFQFEPESGKFIRFVPRFWGQTDNPILSHSGRYCLYFSSRSGMGTIVLYDTIAGKQVSEFGTANLYMAGDIRPVLLPDDARVVFRSGSDIRLWEIGKLLTDKLPKTFPWASVFSPDSKFVAGRLERGGLCLWDVEAGKVIRRFEDSDFATPAAFSPDGKTLAGVLDAGIAFWDVSTGKPLDLAPGHRSPVFSLAFTPGGRGLASRSLTELVYWDASAGKALRRSPVDPDFQGGHLAAQGYLGGPVQCVAVSPDGQFLTDVQAVRETASGKVRHRFESRDDVPDRYGGRPDGPVYIERGRIVRYSPDGQFILRVTDASKDVGVYSASDFRSIGVLADSQPQSRPGYNPSTTCLAVSPDSRTALVGYESGSIRAWNLKTRERRNLSLHHPGAVLNVDISPHDWVVSALVNDFNKKDPTIHIHELATGSLIRAWSSRPFLTAYVACSPCGRFLATCGHSDIPSGNVGRREYPDDRVVRVWNLLTGEPVAAFRGHRGNVNCVAWSPDGTRLASGSDDSTILLWDVSRLPFKVPAPKDPFGDPDTYWPQLGQLDWKEAEPAVLRLIAHPDKAVPLVKAELLKDRSPDPAQLKKLIAQLGHPRQGARTDAARALADLPPAAVEKPLREALAAGPPEEAGPLMRALLGEGSEFLPRRGQVRERRAVQVLEWIGTPDARAALAEVAKKAGGDLGREAGAAVARLDKFRR